MVQTELIPHRTRQGWNLVLQVRDIFAFIDSSTLAKEHPREASRILKLVAGIISVFIPVILPVTGIIIALPQKTAASLMEWLGKPTPEHVIHKFADYQAEIARNKLIDNIQNTDDNEEKVVIIEQLNSLYQKGILTEEELQSKMQKLLG